MTDDTFHNDVCHLRMAWLGPSLQVHYVPCGSWLFPQPLFIIMSGLCGYLLFSWPKYSISVFFVAKPSCLVGTTAVLNTNI